LRKGKKKGDGQNHAWLDGGSSLGKKMETSGGGNKTLLADMGGEGKSGTVMHKKKEGGNLSLDRSKMIKKSPTGEKNRATSRKGAHNLSSNKKGRARLRKSTNEAQFLQGTSPTKGRKGS